ncbi:MAG: molybdopterin-dependent oxidoreductase [Phreatobacter sp.]|uniref:nitrate reductase n=1 Tax=Phreatobacter sp. TaxID=1966341 RepID=UPI001A3AFA3A|nr:nitrate reductase [Phreatobacter sp.]MBL8570901.1 molybdopterin-dependent oxidoreductase [Phreatobacter sp.]
MTAHSHLPNPVATACPYCGVGCGVIASVDGGGQVTVAGDPSHPANRGRLCVKGSALGETVSLEGRLLHPMIRSRSGTMERVSWGTALDAVAEAFGRTAREHGPDATAFYLSGQLLTEDYYVANKLMKGFVGTANVDTNSRLCMASSVAGHRRGFGADTVPGTYEDLDTADLLILVGSNAAWCHPILWQRMVANKAARGARIVVVDPRRTATSADADLMLAIRPGMDGALFSGLLVHLAEAGAIDRAYVEAHVDGFEEALERAREIAPTIGATARACGLAEADVRTLFEWFRTTGKAVTLYSQGVNQSAQGTDKVSAILNCHLATGRIGREGMGPFSLTGQPNAMGGREVGGLANMLAAHMGFSASEIDRVRRFWGAPRMATSEGLKAVQMFDAIEAGAIRALWVMATNPAVSLPKADHVRRALGRLDHFIVSEVVLSNDTVNSGVHILLPAAAWGEKDGTVTNSERRITRQRPFLPLPGEARSDWWIVAEVARRMGFAEAFSWDNAAAVFREHAALSAFENRGARDFDIGGLATVSDAEFDALRAIQWPVRNIRDTADKRFFAEGRFFTADGRARMIAIAPPALKAEAGENRPFLLNTGRVRDHWHTMTRTGRAPTLGRHIVEPFTEIHPDDAAAAGIGPGDFVRVETDHGAATLRVVLSEGQMRGAVFVPIHWSDETAGSARVGALVQPFTDPFSGQPEMKATPASLSRVEMLVEGFILSRGPVALPDGLRWARAAVEGGVGTVLASDLPVDGRAVAEALAGQDGTITEMTDAARGIYRAAVFRDGGLEAVLFLALDGRPSWNWIETQFGLKDLPPAARKALLSGRSPEGIADAGPTVCACFAVGLTTIRDAIAAGACDVDAVGRALKAGTNCGSCRPEIKKLIEAEAKLVPA